MSNTSEGLTEIRQLVDKLLVDLQTVHTSKIDFHITPEGKAALQDRWLRNELTPSLPDCTIKIAVSSDTVNVSVWHKDIKFAEFDTRNINNESSHIYELSHASVGLKLDWG